MLQLFVSSRPSAIMQTVPHFSLEKSWFARQQQPYQKKHFNKAWNYLISDIKAAIKRHQAADTLSSQYLFLDEPMLTRKQRVVLYQAISPLTTVHVSYEVLPTLQKDGRFSIYDELKQQIPKIGVDCDQYSILGPDFFSKVPDLNQISSLDELREYVAAPWLADFDANFQDHDTPHHLERIDSHMAMAHALALKEAPDFAITALLHDLGKGLAKKIDEQGVARFVGHEFRGASLAFLMSRQIPALQNAQVPEQIYQHMRAHHGFSDKVIRRECLSSADLAKFESFARIDSQARKI
jgi:hypothetical protein